MIKFKRYILCGQVWVKYKISILPADDPATIEPGSSSRSSTRLAAISVSEGVVDTRSLN
jgi:hypothetical protein